MSHPQNKRTTPVLPTIVGEAFEETDTAELAAAALVEAVPDLKPIELQAAIHYATHGNAAAVARALGIDRTYAWKIVRRPVVKRAVTVIHREAAMTKAETLARLSTRARASLAPLINPATGAIDRDAVAQAAHQHPNIKRLTIAPDGSIAVEMHDALPALLKLLDLHTRTDPEASHAGNPTNLTQTNIFLSGQRTETPHKG